MFCTMVIVFISHLIYSHISSVNNPSIQHCNECCWQKLLLILFVCICHYNAIAGQNAENAFYEGLSRVFHIAKIGFKSLYGLHYNVFITLEAIILSYTGKYTLRCIFAYLKANSKFYAILKLKILYQHKCWLFTTTINRTIIINISYFQFLNSMLIIIGCWKCR